MNRFNFSIILLALVLAACAGNSQVVTNTPKSEEHLKQQVDTQYLEALKSVHAESEGLQADGTKVTCSRWMTTMLCGKDYPNCNMIRWSCVRQPVSIMELQLKFLRKLGVPSVGWQNDRSNVVCRQHPDFASFAKAMEQSYGEAYCQGNRDGDGTLHPLHFVEFEGGEAGISTTVEMDPNSNFGCVRHFSNKVKCR